MKGEEKLWGILNDKLETLRAGNRLPEATRVADTALRVARRSFAKDDLSLALSYERLGELYDLQRSARRRSPVSCQSAADR